MTQTTTYKPTFLQKFLGRNYKWWYCLIYYFRLQTNYRIDTFFNVLQNQLRFISSILIWFITIRSGANLNLQQILTYFLIGSLLAQSWNSQVADWNLYYDNKTGKLSSILMRPNSIFIYYFFRNLGSDIFYALWNILFLFIFILIFHNYITYTLLTNLLFLFFLMILARAIVYFYQIICGSITFWSTEGGGIFRTASFILNFCSGSIFPLDLIDETKFLKFNPFAWCFYHPMQIYLGKYSNLEIFYVFLGGIFWCLVLYFLAKLVFKMGLKRNEAVGL
jgi:ABC-2 type transport system permease protein